MRVNIKWGKRPVSGEMYPLTPGVAQPRLYHIRLIYQSGGITSHLYEINKPRNLVNDIVYQIENLVPSIRFDGARVYPKRIFGYRIFVSDSPFDKSSESLREEHPAGYNGNFGGTDVTLELTQPHRETPPPRTDSIRIFLSYSSEDAILTGEFKKNLESKGFEVFMAQKDIEAGDEWEVEILRNLDECDIFIPLITENFKKSSWTDQESGIAFNEGKLIIPLKIQLVPYGFIGRYQALEFDGDISQACEKIMDIVMQSPLYDKVKDFFIKSFVESKHFDEANYRVKKIEAFDTFTPNQINEIIRGYVNNLEIRGGFDSGPFVLELYDKFSDYIDPELKEKFEACDETKWAREHP